jgi:hypothetical protein
LGHGNVLKHDTTESKMKIITFPVRRLDAGPLLDSDNGDEGQIVVSGRLEK